MNYIVISDGDRYYDYAYAQLNENTGFTRFISRFPNVNRLFRKILRYPKPNLPLWKKIKTLYLESLLAPVKKAVAEMSDPSAPLCIILFPYIIPLEEYNISNMLRKIIPSTSSVKILYFLTDLVEKHIEKQQLLSQWRNRPDFILTYDPGDAEKYDLIFHNIPYSNILKSSPVEYDIAFIGRARRRMSEIVSAFEFFHAKGLNCCFHIVGAQKHEKVYPDLIHYSKLMPYDYYLNIISRTNCILEIIQHGSKGNTLRIPEAIALDKKLITNNPYAETNSLYFPKYMQVYRKLEDIDINKAISREEVNYPESLKYAMSPMAFIDFLDERLRDTP